MPVNFPNLELLWKRLDDAKLRLDHCHDSVRGMIQHDKISGAVPAADGNYPRVQGLKAQEFAFARYLRAVNDYKAALLSQESLESPSPTPADDGFCITPREREVLARIASGKSSREIAEEFGIAFKTIVTHRYRLLKKLNVHNTADLTRIAIRMGLAQP